jgi:hypothetical protein
MAAWFEDDVSGPEVRVQKPVETTLACPVCTPCEVCAGQRSITRTAVPLLAKEYTLVKKKWEESSFRMSWSDAVDCIPWYKNPMDVWFWVCVMSILLTMIYAGTVNENSSLVLSIVIFGALIVMIMPGSHFASKKRDAMVESIKQEAQEAARKRYESLLQQIDPSLTPDNVTFDWYDAPDKVVLCRQDELVE